MIMNDTGLKESTSGLFESTTLLFGWKNDKNHGN
jgi:hypothetical protein